VCLFFKKQGRIKKDTRKKVIFSSKVAWWAESSRGFKYIVAVHVRQTKGRVSHAAFFFAGPAAQREASEKDDPSEIRKRSVTMTKQPRPLRF